MKKDLLEFIEEIVAKAEKNQPSVRYARYVVEHMSEDHRLLKNREGWKMLIWNLLRPFTYDNGEVSEMQIFMQESAEKYLLPSWYDEDDLKNEVEDLSADEYDMYTEDDVIDELEKPDCIRVNNLVVIINEAETIRTHWNPPFMVDEIIQGFVEPPEEEEDGDEEEEDDEE